MAATRRCAGRAVLRRISGAPRLAGRAHARRQGSSLTVDADDGTGAGIAASHRQLVASSFPDRANARCPRRLR